MSRFYAFESIPDILLDVGVRAHFSKGSVIIRLGDPIEGFYCVLSGQVWGYVPDAGQGQVTLAYVEENACFSEADFLLGNMQSSSEFVAFSDCDLVFIPREEAEELAFGNAEVASYLAQCVARKFLTSLEMYTDAADSPAIERVCKTLLDLDQRYGSDWMGLRLIDAEISQQYLANYLKLSRLTINKCIGKLRDDGMLRKIDNCYAIVDREKLVRYMEVMK